jgi:hypothetical protein
MPTFSDGESGASIRSKLNSTIATVDALTDQYAWKTIAVSGQDSVVADAVDDTLTLVAGTGMSITTNAAGDSITFAATAGGGSVDQIVYVSKAAAEAATFSAAPDTLLLSGFNLANEFGYAKAYAYAGTTDPGHAGVVTIPISGVNYYYEPDIDSMVTPQMYGGNEEGVRQALQRGRWVDLGVGKTYQILTTIGITNPDVYVVGHDVTFTPSASRGLGAMGAMFVFDQVDNLYWTARCVMDLQLKFSAGIFHSAKTINSEVHMQGITVNNPYYVEDIDYSADYVITHSGAGSTISGLYWGGSYGFGFEGWWSAGVQKEYKSLHVEDCHVSGVVRASPGTSRGFYLSFALKTRLIGCTVNGAYVNYTLTAPASNAGDADGVFSAGPSRTISGNLYYVPNDFLMENCTIKNCQGRFVKTQQGGYSVIRNNKFILDLSMDSGTNAFRTITGPSAAPWYGIDEQDMPSLVDDNVFDIHPFFYDNETGNSKAKLLGHRAGRVSFAFINPPVTVGGETYPKSDVFQGNVGFGSFRRNHVILRNTASSSTYALQTIISMDLTALAARNDPRYMTYDYSDNVVTCGKRFAGGGGWGTGDYVAVHFIEPNTGALSTYGSKAVVRVRNNYAQTSDFVGSGYATSDANVLAEVTNNTLESTGSGNFVFGVGTEVTRDNTTI